MPFGDDDEGIQSDGFEAGSIKQCHIQTSSELLCQYGICQTDTLSVLFEAGGNGAVNNLLFGKSGVDGCHLLSHGPDCGFGIRPVTEYRSTVPEWRRLS